MELTQSVPVEGLDFPEVDLPRLGRPACKEGFCAGALGSGLGLGQ